MKNLKRALFLLLVLAIGMPTVAMADVFYESMEAAFTNKILKISLENGYDLTENRCIYDNEESIISLSDGEGASLAIGSDGIPIYRVKVPAGTEYVYMYTVQDPDNGDKYAHSQYGAYSAASVYTIDGDGSMAESGWNAWKTLAMTEPGIIAEDINGNVLRQTVAKVKVPVAQPNPEYEDMMPVTLFCQDMPDPETAVCPFALYFEETEMDVSAVTAEYVELTMEDAYTWNVDPADIKNGNPTLSVHPIGANNITNVTWESSDPSIVSVESISKLNDIDEETDSRMISTATLVPHKTGVVTITVKGGDFEKTSTVTVKAPNCTHAATAETCAPVEGEQKHSVITACDFCGVQVGDVTTENCADGNADGACDLCGGEVKAEEPEVNTPAVSVPDGAPFSAITTDKGGVISVVEAGELAVDPWGMGSGYAGTVYHVVIPEGATSADITLNMPFSAMQYYTDDKGKPTTIAGYIGNAVYDNDEGFDPGMNGGSASFEFVSPDSNSTVITVPMEIRGKSLVKPADFNPDESSPYYAAGPEYADYSAVCYFTFEYGTAAGGEEPECSHEGTETTTAYVQVADTETHTVTVTCECGEQVGEVTTENCIDENADYLCDLCGGEVKVNIPITELNFWVNEVKVTEVSVKAGEMVDAIASCTPKATTENIVLFSSSDSEVLSVSDEEVTADGTYGHAKTTIKGEKVGEAILTAVSKTNPNVSTQLKVTVTCNHVGTDTTNSYAYESVGGGVHNTVTSVYCSCGEFIRQSTSLNDDCVDENTDGQCDLCGGEVDVPVVIAPTEIYNSAKHGAWGTTVSVQRLAVSGVQVKSFEWTADNSACIVTVTKNTPKDAVITFEANLAQTTNRNPAVLFVNGTINGTAQLENGEATVTVKVANRFGNMPTARTIKFITEGEAIIPVERIEVSDGRVVAGSSMQLTATVYPENATIKDVKWSTSAASTNLTVTEGGKVSGQTMGLGGYYTVTATSVSNPEISASCKVFLDWKPETSIALDKETMTVKIGQPVRLTATISGTQFVTNTTATWTSSDESIATVDGGKVTGLKTGTVTITATSYYGLTATCEVTVECPHIGMETATAYEHIDGTETHTAVNTCVCGYMLGSSTEDCADENADGKCDKCEGDVALPVYTIELDKSEASVWFFADDQQIPTGYEAYAADFPKTAELKATVKVNDVETDAAEVVWTSSNAAVATVENGVVTATGAGEAVITAAVNDVAASCTVKVESFIAPVYMNVELVGEFDYSVNQPEGETARVIDLTDETQARTITISAPLYQNVNDVKTLASMQGVTWEIEGAAECVETVVNDDFTLTATFTGKPGVVNFKPVMLNGNTNVRLPIYVSNGFVTEVNIVRKDGEDWVYGEKETIGGVERDVIEIVEGSSITAVSSATNVTQTYNGWMLMRYDDEYATDQTSGSNGASFDLSKLKVGLYSLVLRVPSYEQDYNIDPLGGNPQDRINSERIYIRVVEKNAMGDVSGDGNINANDAVLILQAAAGGAMSEAQIAAADMNNDGKIDANDAVLILQYSAN